MTNRPAFLTRAALAVAIASAGCNGDPAKIDATAVSRAGLTTAVARIDFQPASAPTPTGYTAEAGVPYSGARGFGFVTAASLTEPVHVPIGMAVHTRDRNRAGIEQRLDTIVHLQPPAAPNTVAAWELAVAPGVYRVAITAGDMYRDSRHVVRVEGVRAIDGFVPTDAEEYRSAVVEVAVVDGRLTVDPIGGQNTKLAYVEIDHLSERAPSQPAVRAVSPAAGATGVALDAFIAADLVLPNVGAGVSNESLTSEAVRLVHAGTGAPVAASLNTSAAGDVIVLSPLQPLAPLTTYRFEVTSAVRDTSGARFFPLSSTFTTGEGGGGEATVAFDKVALPTTDGRAYTSLTVGPDGKLYAGTLSGEIVRFALGAGGTTGPAEVISTLTSGAGSRVIIGVAFDPAATANNLILYVSHGPAALTDAPEWSGKITRLSGANLQIAQDVVVNLPRSIRDHLTNSIAFKPGEPGVLYFNQGSNTAMGGADSGWGWRPERLLTAAVLRLDLAKLGALPLDVKTEEGGSYNPFSPGAPLTIFATGVRNAYDLVWHSNGELYVPTNGSAAGGSTPATPAVLPASCARRIYGGSYSGPAVPALSGVPTAQSDFLFRIAAGGYYGHPNPARCEWTLNGGNPTSGGDIAEVQSYPIGTLPDPNWRGAVFDFGEHRSPNGALEYRGGAFGGRLRGKLLVTRYSGGDDIIVLTIDPTTKGIAAAETGAPGLTGFDAPLDLAEDPATGNLYVSELGDNKLTLLRPRP